MTPSRTSSGSSRKFPHDPLELQSWFCFPCQPSDITMPQFGAGGAWIAAPHVNHRGTTSNNPILWRFEWPEDIKKSLISFQNPNGTITNSDHKLASGLIHLDVAAHCYDIRERTVLSKIDNMATMFWSRKGSTTTNKVPAYLLCLFSIHQRYH